MTDKLPDPVELLAMELHESTRPKRQPGDAPVGEHFEPRARAANVRAQRRLDDADVRQGDVRQGKTVHVEEPQTFLEWDDVTESDREGLRVQARFLLARFHVNPKGK